MKKLLLSLFISTILFSCKEEPEITMNTKFNPEKYTVHLIMLENKNKLDNGYELSKAIKENPSFIDGFTNKTYSEIIPGLMLKSKEQKKIRLDEKKKSDELNQKIITKLEKKFKKKVDEFNGIGWYYHKSWGARWLNRKGLRADINTDGYCYLVSNYHSSDWLFHTKIKVIVNGTTYTSSEIKRFDDSNKSDNSGGKIWEVIQYSKGRDNGILKAIAKNSDKVIKVRFIGREFKDDIILSSKDKLAIKDCYELSKALR